MTGPDDDRRQLLDGLDHFDGDVHRVRDGVVHGRALLRLRDDRLDVLLRRVRVDVEGHLDVAVAVAHVAVHAENPLDVHLAFELRLDRAELDTTILRNRRDARGEAARQPDEDVLDRRDPVVLRREDLGMVGLEARLGLVRLLLTKAEEAFDRRLAVRAFHPLAGCSPRELCCLGRALERIARIEERLHVDSVVHRRHCHVNPLSGDASSSAGARNHITRDIPGSGPRYHRPRGHVSANDRCRLGGHDRNAVSGPSAAGPARLRARVASDPRRLRDVRNALPGTGQRDPGLSRAERRRACRGVCEDASAGEHARRLRRRRS